MSFNFKSYMEKQAAKQKPITEVQLKNKGKETAQLQESQLEKTRRKSPTGVAEKQLESVRSDNTIFYTTEGQLENRCCAPDQTVEVQLESRRCSCNNPLIENDLSKVRESSFNFREFMMKKSSKKSDVITEKQLDQDNDGPNKLTNSQLEEKRVKKSEYEPLTEQLLEKSRTGEQNKLVEGLLDSRKSLIMTHRNAKTAQGDINKLDEQRKFVKKDETYKPASETDKKMMLPEIEGDDGLRTANSKGVTKTASVPSENEFGFGLNEDAMKILKQYGIGQNQLYRFDSPQGGFTEIYDAIQKAKKGDNSFLKPALEKQFGKKNFLNRMLGETNTKQNKFAQYDVPVELGFLERDNPDWTPDDDADPFERLQPDLDEIDNGGVQDELAEYGDLIDKVTSGIDEPTDEELENLKINDPDADTTFDTDSVRDISVGSTFLRQVILSFNPSDFNDESDVKRQAATFMLVNYPPLFNFEVDGEPINIANNLNVNMDKGTITATLPVEAFKPKKLK